MDAFAYLDTDLPAGGMFVENRCHRSQPNIVNLDSKHTDNYPETTCYESLLDMTVDDTHIDGFSISNGLDDLNDRDDLSQPFNHYDKYINDNSHCLGFNTHTLLHGVFIPANFDSDYTWQKEALEVHHEQYHDVIENAHGGIFDSEPCVYSDPQNQSTIATPPSSVSSSPHKPYSPPPSFPADIESQLLERLAQHYNSELRAGRITNLPPGIPSVATVKPPRKERVKAEVPSPTKIATTKSLYASAQGPLLDWLVRILPNNIDISFFSSLPPSEWVYVTPSGITSLLDMSISLVPHSKLSPIACRGTSEVQGELYEPRVKRVRRSDLQLLQYCKTKGLSDTICKVVEKALYKNSESLCPYCEVENYKANANGLGFYFHKMSNSDYLHHLLKHHGVFSNSTEVPIPRVGTSKGSWSAFCPYCGIECKMKHYGVRFKEGEHHFLSLLRHCDAAHKQGKNLA